MRRKDTPPKWERQVNQTIEKIKKKSKSKTLKSSNIFECICIFIFDHLKKNIRTCNHCHFLSTIASIF